MTASKCASKDNHVENKVGYLRKMDNGLFTPLTDVMLVTGNGCSDTAVTAKVGLFSLADRLTTANFQLNVCNLDISFDLCLRFFLY